MKFGVHISIAGGLHTGLKRAVKVGCEAVQLFLGNPRGWRMAPLKDEDIELFQEIRNTEAKHIHPIAAHMPYLPNLASSDKEIFEKSVESLQENLRRCDAFQIDYLIIHMGRGKNHGGIKRMQEGILRAYDEKTYNVCLLIENTAGQGNEIGFQLPEISELYNHLPESISKGICLDTCHAFAAGYDIRSTSVLNKIKKDIQQHIGFIEVKLIHLNDAMKPLGSHIDRHAKIGEGEIGIEGFKTFVNTPKFKTLPGILEIPRKSEEEDIEQLKLIKSLSNKRRK